MEPIPKGKSVAACCIEIKISVIGVGEQVGGELVVIPYKPCLILRRMLPILIWQSLRSLHNGRMPILRHHSESFGGGTPRVFFCRRGSVNVYMESGRWSIWAVTFPALNASRQTNAICCSFILYGLVYTRVTGLLKTR